MTVTLMSPCKLLSTCRKQAKEKKRKHWTFIAPWQKELQQHSLCGASNGQVYYSVHQFHWDSNQEDGQQEKAMTEITHTVLFNQAVEMENREIGVGAPVT